MNKNEARSDQQRRAGLKFSMMIWTAAVALLVTVLLIVGLSNSAPSSFYTRAALIAAVVLLVLRQIGRRLRGRGSKAAEPDPKSALKLD